MNETNKPNPQTSYKCPRCGEVGPHYVPPSLGESGFYICENKAAISEDVMAERRQSALSDTMKTYGLTDTSLPLIELSRKQGPDVPGKPLDNLTDRQLAYAVRMVLRSDIMLETICCAARDRIVKLSEQIEQLKLRTECQCAGGEAGERIHSPSRPVHGPQSLLKLQVEMRTRERDEAIQEASRRDQKWMDGIDEICGRKLSYKHDPSDSSACTLQDFINELRTEKVAVHWCFKAADEMAIAVLDLIDRGLMDSRSRVADAHLNYCAARTGASGDEVNAFRKMLNPLEESR